MRTTTSCWSTRPTAPTPVDITTGSPTAERNPAVSPDGKRIAFERGGDIFVAGIDGSAPTNLTNAFDGASPQWEYVYTCGKKRATMVGTESRDVIKGSKGPDVIVGNGANDKLVGKGGKDTICGGRGNDKLKGARKGDRLFGQTGKDRLIGGAGPDLLKGGKGKDVETQ